MHLAQLVEVKGDISLEAVQVYGGGMGGSMGMGGSNGNRWNAISHKWVVE